MLLNLSEYFHGLVSGKSTIIPRNLELKQRTMRDGVRRYIVLIAQFKDKEDYERKIFVRRGRNDFSKHYDSHSR